MRDGDIITAEVVNVDADGIFLQAEGLNGVVRLNEISWDPRHTSPFDVAKAGELITVFVYAVTPAAFYASVRMVHPERNPWKNHDRFKAGDRYAGVVESIADWGTAVRIAEGVDGIILHEKYDVSFAVGSTVNVEIVGVDLAVKRIELKPCI